MQRLWIAGVAALAVVSSISAASVSEPAPGFALKARSGDTVTLGDLKGQVVMINFWATWCGPCRQEMPHLEALYERYQSLGFTLLGINVEQDPKGADKWLKETPVSFPVLFDPDNAVTKLYDVVAMPSTVIIDRQGKVRFIHHGYKPGYEDAYQTQVRTLLGER